MDWRFWERGVKELPEQARKYLSNEFKMSPESIADLRCVVERGPFCGRIVTRIKIFKLADVAETGKISYSTIPSDLILFEGHIEKDSTHLKKKEEGK